MSATLAGWDDKDPTDVKDYTVSWAAEMAARSDTIATSVFTAPVGITIDSQSNSTTTSTVWLSGGTADNSYEITCTVVTAGGRTLQRSVSLRVVNR
jgi:hypothetical protein